MLQHFEGMSLVIRDTDSPPSAQTFAQVDVKLVVENAEMLLSTMTTESVNNSHRFDERTHNAELDFPTSSRVEDTAGLLTDTPHTGKLPLLGLRGCTPIQGGSLKNARYAIDIGQQTLRSGAMIEWEVTLERLLPMATGILLLDTAYWL